MPIGPHIVRGSKEPFFLRSQQATGDGSAGDAAPVLLVDARLPSLCFTFYRKSSLLTFPDSTPIFYPARIPPPDEDFSSMGKICRSSATF